MPHISRKSGSTKINTFQLFYEGMCTISMKGNEPKDGYATNKGRQYWVDRYF
jgi:hypothetical protein